MSQTRREMFDEMFLDCGSVDLDKIRIRPHGIEHVDMVLNPPHYNQNGIETIDYMRAYSTHEEFCGHCRLTAIKYLSRMNIKDEPLENAKKARWYIDRLIEELENEKTITD